MTAAPELQFQHREADTRLVWHANYISTKKPHCNVAIRCDNTDILLNMLPHVSSFNIHAWMDVGKSSNNTKHYIDIDMTDLVQELGPGLCQALHGFHHFTGSDYTPAFFKKGKMRPLQIMETSYVDTFSQLGMSENLAAAVVSKLRAFVCEIYGKSSITSVNWTRYEHFLQAFRPDESSEPLKALREVEPSMFPTCRVVLMQKIKRATYAAHMCRNATFAQPCIWNAENNGWKLVQGKYAMYSFDGSEVPLKSILTSKDEDEHPVYNDI